MKKVIRIREFPLEAEAMIRAAQYELEKLSHEELLTFSKQTLVTLDKLRHYAKELLDALEEVGIEVEPS